VTQHIPKKRKQDLVRKPPGDNPQQIESTPNEILKLQSTIGNQQVQRLLRQKNHPSKTLSKSSILQRQPTPSNNPDWMTKLKDFGLDLLKDIAKDAFFTNLRTLNRSQFKDKEMREKFKEFMEQQAQGKLTENERWLADVLLVYGEEKNWPFYVAKDALAKKDIEHLLKKDDLKQHEAHLKDAIVEDTLGFSNPFSKDDKTQYPLKSYYVEGTSSERALIIGGMHGSELSGVEVAEKLVEKIKASTTKPYYTVIIIPQLFPANVALAKAKKQPKTNWGRYTPKQDPTTLDYNKYAKDEGDTRHKDPNRQYFKAGQAPDLSPNAVDATGEAIEKETAILAKLIAFYKPSRIANIHSIHTPNDAGIYVDPPTDAEQNPITDKKDGPTLDDARALDKRMWEFAKSKGATVTGNTRARGAEKPEQYPLDPEFAAPGKKQKRSSGQAPDKGTSTGVYYSTGVNDTTASQFNRAPLIWVTVEVAGGKTSDGDKDRAKELEAHTLTLQEIFLGPDGAKANKP
jgi:hypothetical protein